MKTKVQVKDLKAGDQLSSCMVLGTPIDVSVYLGKKNMMAISVQYGNNRPKTAMWGKYTTVTVTNR